MISFSIGSTMEREDLFAEVYINNSQWAEVSIDESKKKVNIIIYCFSKLAKGNKQLLVVINQRYHQVLENIQVAQVE